MSLYSDPRLLFKALNSVVKVIDTVKPVSSEVTKNVRCTQVFSAIHGFLGLPRLVLDLRTTTSRNYVMLGWKITKTVKEFVTSISWCFKVAYEAGYLKVQEIAWTAQFSKIYPHYQVLALTATTLKTKKACALWMRSSDVQQIPLLRYRALVSLCHVAAKGFTLSSYMLEALFPQAKLAFSLNLLAISVIRLAILYLGSSIYAQYQN